jgi:hypothetical protein
VGDEGSTELVPPGKYLVMAALVSAIIIALMQIVAAIVQ